MLKIIISLFLTGVTLGLGPCLASCGPVLLTYIAGTKSTPLSGVRTYVVFSLGRLLVYVLLGVLSGIFGQIFAGTFYDNKIAVYIWMAGAVFVIVLGILTAIGISPHIRLLEKITKFTINRDTKSVFLLGVFIGLTPCGPLLGVLSYIALVSKTILHGLLYSLAFGIGSVVSPLIILSAFAGFIPAKLTRYIKALRYLRVVAGIILVYLGIKLLLSPWFRG